jgi:molybdenum cofactor synthesis domain-containing protein
MSLHEQPLRVAILTASTKGAQGEREDTSGAAIREISEAAGWSVAEAVILPDDRATISAALVRFADDLNVDVVFTTGGTGLGPHDVTPQATLEVIDYQVPGMAEAMRADGLTHTPMAMLSRAVVGVRGRTLIVNLPGSPMGVRESLAVVRPVIPHAVQVLREPAVEHHPR